MKIRPAQALDDGVDQLGWLFDDDVRAVAGELLGEGIEVAVVEVDEVPRVVDGPDRVRARRRGCCPVSRRAARRKLGWVCGRAPPGAPSHGARGPPREPRMHLPDPRP